MFEEAREIELALSWETAVKAAPLQDIHDQARRIGKKKAAVAVAHSIVVTGWHMLTNNVDDHDLRVSVSV